MELRVETLEREKSNRDATIHKLEKVIESLRSEVKHYQIKLEEVLREMADGGNNGVF